MISGGLEPAKTWSGAWVPSQRWGWVETVKAQVLATRPGVSDKGPGPGPSALQKEVPQRWKVTKQVFINRKKSTVCVDRYTGGHECR